VANELYDSSEPRIPERSVSVPSVVDSVVDSSVDSSVVSVRTVVLESPPDS